MSRKSNEGHRARAEASFKKKELQAQEADKVWIERVTAAAALDQNAARLRALRLAKEAVDRTEKPKPVAKARKKTSV